MARSFPFRKAGKTVSESPSAQMRSRTVIAIGCFVLVYAAIGARLVQYGMTKVDDASHYIANDRTLAARPDIVDRNGDVMATDIRVASLYGEPRRIVDADEAVEALSSVLPDVDYKEWHRKLSSGAGFVWLRRELTPRQQADVLALGIPGLGFRTETRRFYPGGPVASHIIGLVNIDNAGIAGLEKYIDDQGLGTMQDLGLDVGADLAPVKVSIDQRVQYVMRDELSHAIERYQAIAAGGVVLNVHTGEVIGMVSLPDYDPNNPYNALDKDRLNRMSAGVYEMGSTFKSFTTAMALDSGKVKITDKFDTSPFRVGGYTIKEFHSKHRPLSVPEIFEYSSNVGSAREADLIGVEGHRAFLTRMGLLSRLHTELPEVAMPTQPKEWKKINSMTAAFGHGIATTPLQHGRCRRGADEWRLPDPADLPAAHAGRGDAAGETRGEAEDQRRDALHVRVERQKGVRAAGAGGGLSRRRQDRHGRKGRQRPLCRQQALQRLSRLVPDRPPGLCRAGGGRRTETRARLRTGRDGGLQRGADRRRHHPPGRTSPRRDARVRQRR